MKSTLKRILFSDKLYLIIIIALGFLLRLYKIDNPIADWHSWRQADTVSVSRIYVDEGINIFYPKYYDISSIQSGITNFRGLRFVEFPLFNALNAGFAKIFPVYSVEVWGRLISIVSSLFSICFIYLLGKKYISKVGGLLSALFFAILPYNIYFSRVILPEPLSVCLGLIGIWYLINFVEKERIKNLIISGIFFALAILVKPHVIFFIIPPVFIFIEKKGMDGVFTSKNIIKFLVFLSVIFIPFIAWRGWVNMYPEGIPFTKWSFNGDHIRFRFAFWRWLFVERLGKLILGVWGVFPFLTSIAFYRRKYHFVYYFLLSMFLYVSIFATVNIRHDYYQIYLIPSIALALGVGSVSLIERKSKMTNLVLLFSVLLMFGSGIYQVKDFYQINHPEIIEAGKKVNEITPKDAWIIAPYNGDTAFLYQTKRYGWPAIDNSFEHLIRKGADYYVSVTPNDADSIFVRKNFEIIYETDKYFIADLKKPKQI